MGVLLVIPVGAAVGVVATLDALYWHSPSMPGWSLPALGLAITVWIIIAEVLGQ
jgi:hypothetical protein